MPQSDLVRPSCQADWDAQYDNIRKMWWDDGLKLTNIIEIMQREHHFSATEKQYKRMLDKWNLGKNVKTSEMKAIVKIQTRRLPKATEFFVRDQPVPRQKISRFMKRTMGTVAPSPSNLSPLAFTPFQVHYFTPPISYNSALDLRVTEIPGSASDKDSWMREYINFPNSQTSSSSPRLDDQQQSQTSEEIEDTAGNVMAENSKGEQQLDDALFDSRVFNGFEEVLIQERADDAAEGRWIALYTAIERHRSVNAPGAVFEAWADETAADVENQRLSHIDIAADTQFIEFLLDTADSTLSTAHPIGVLVKYILEHGPSNLVKHLLDPGADGSAVDKYGVPALHYAVRAGNLGMTRTLLSCGTQINQRGPDRQTALHIAVEWGSLEMIKLLLDHKADIEVKDQWGRTPSSYATFRYNDESISALFSRLPEDGLVLEEV